MSKLNMKPLSDIIKETKADNYRQVSAIELHYFVNNCFIQDNFIITNIHKIVKIPAVIVQGRHDVICPPYNALKLSSIWDAATIEIVEDAGHSAFEVNIARKLINTLHMIK